MSDIFENQMRVRVYLANGIGRAVKYHRTENPGELQQGIKILGDGALETGKSL